MSDASRHLITDYRNVPGEHCGSTAMRNLVFHYCGLELSEEEIFGLGSGVDLWLIENETFIPGIVLFGRGPTLETDVADALGIDYREQAEPDDAKAWSDVKAEVAAGRPTMLSGDALYLDYRDFRVHFPAHRFVLLGFDDARNTAFVADRIDVETQECSYDALAKSRNPPDYASTLNLWGRFHGTRAERPLPEAFRIALARTAARMTGVESGRADVVSAGDANGEHRETAGLAAFAHFAEILERLPDHPRGAEIARYAGSCIEAFGTGGGNFRALFTGFLAKAREAVPENVPASAPADAGEASRNWTRISEKLSAYSKTGERVELDSAREILTDLAAIETRLFEGLAAANGL